MINLKTLTASVVLAVLNCPLVSANSNYSNLALRLKANKFNNNAKMAVVTLSAELNIPNESRDITLNSMKQWEVTFRKNCPERDSEGSLIKDSEICNRVYKNYTDNVIKYIVSTNTRASEIFKMIYLAELQSELHRTQNNPYRY